MLKELVLFFYIFSVGIVNILNMVSGGSGGLFLDQSYTTYFNEDPNITSNLAAINETSTNSFNQMNTTINTMESAGGDPLSVGNNLYNILYNATVGIYQILVGVFLAPFHFIAILASLMKTIFTGAGWHIDRMMELTQGFFLLLLGWVVIWEGILGRQAK